MKMYLAAVRHLHMSSEEYADPLCNLLQLDLLIRGARRAQPASSYKDQHLPITPLILSRIHETLYEDPDN